MFDFRRVGGDVEEAQNFPFALLDTGEKRPCDMRDAFGVLEPAEPDAAQDVPFEAQFIGIFRAVGDGEERSRLGVPGQAGEAFRIACRALAGGPPGAVLRP